MTETPVVAVWLLQCTGIPQEMAERWKVTMVPKGHTNGINLELADGTNIVGTPKYQTAEEAAQNYPGVRIQISGSSAICKECNITALRAAGRDEEFIKQVAALYE